MLPGCLVEVPWDGRFLLGQLLTPLDDATCQVAPIIVIIMLTILLLLLLLIIIIMIIMIIMIIT